MGLEKQIENEEVDVDRTFDQLTLWRIISKMHRSANTLLKDLDFDGFQHLLDRLEIIEEDEEAWHKMTGETGYESSMKSVKMGLAKLTEWHPFDESTISLNMLNLLLLWPSISKFLNFECTDEPILNWYVRALIVYLQDDFNTEVASFSHLRCMLNSFDLDEGIADLHKDKFKKQFLNQNDPRGRTALHWISEYSDESAGALSFFLIINGMNYNIKDHQGQTPFIQAAMNGNIRQLAILYQASLDPNSNCDRRSLLLARDNSGCSSLHWAAYKDEVRATEILSSKVSPLFIKEIDWSTKDDMGRSALHRAAQGLASKVIDKRLLDLRNDLEKGVISISDALSILEDKDNQGLTMESLIKQGLTKAPIIEELKKLDICTDPMENDLCLESIKYHRHKVSSYKETVVLPYGSFRNILRRALTAVEDNALALIVFAFVVFTTFIWFTLLASNSNRIEIWFVPNVFKIPVTHFEPNPICDLIMGGVLFTTIRIMQWPRKKEKTQSYHDNYASIIKDHRGGNFKELLSKEGAYNGCPDITILDLYMWKTNQIDTLMQFMSDRLTNTKDQKVISDMTYYNKYSPEILSISREFDPASMCITCWNYKPLRSKHCRYCNCCQNVMDHHCDWIGRCVTEKNHRFFTGWLIHLIMAQMILVPCCASKIYETRNLSAPYNKGVLLIAALFWLILMITYIVLGGWIVFLLIEQLTCIFRNVTFNERYSIGSYMKHWTSVAYTVEYKVGTPWLRLLNISYLNPFNEGWMKNIRMFMSSSRNAPDAYATKNTKGDILSSYANILPFTGVIDPNNRYDPPDNACNKMKKQVKRWYPRFLSTNSLIKKTL